MKAALYNTPGPARAATRPFVLIIAAALLLAACSIKRTDTDFRVVTAKEVGVKSQDVTILSSEGGSYGPLAGVTGVQGFKWTAQTPKGTYLCNSDVNLTRTICDKKT